MESTPLLVRRFAGSALAPALLGFLVFVATLPPSVLWGGGDFARLQLWASKLHLEGGSLGHPLWVLLAHPFTYLPLGDSAYRASLATAVMGAMTLGIFFTHVRELTRSVPGAWIGTAALGVSHMFWTYAVMPKVYALNAFLLVLALFVALRWHRQHRLHHLYGLAAILGIAVHAHFLFVVLLPSFAAFVVAARRGEKVTSLLGALSVTVGIAALFVLWPSSGSPAFTDLAIAHIRGFIGVLVSPRKLALGLGVSMALIAYQFLGTLYLLRRGVTELKESSPTYFWLLLGLVVSDVAFVWSWIPQTPTLSTYVQNWHFYLPVVVLLAITVGAGAAARWPSLTKRGRGMLIAVVVALPVLVYAVAPIVGGDVVDRLSLRALPGRDNATYLLSPWKHTEDGAGPFGQNLLEALPPRATVLADYSIYWVLRYVRDEKGVRPDVRLVELPTRLEVQAELARAEATRRRRMFISDTNEYYAVGAFRQDFVIEKVGPVWELKPKN